MSTFGGFAGTILAVVIVILLGPAASLWVCAGLGFSLSLLGFCIGMAAER